MTTTETAKQFLVGKCAQLAPVTTPLVETHPTTRANCNLRARLAQLERDQDDAQVLSEIVAIRAALSKALEAEQSEATDA